MNLSLSIIIPAYKEDLRLGATLRSVFAYLNEHLPHSEVIVIDDGSPDRTSAVANQSFADAARVQTRLIRVEPNKGKGNAVREGMLAAKAPIALFSDADLSTPIAEAPKLIAPISAGQYDVVFGSRALDRTLIGTHQSWRREQGGKMINRIIRFGTGLPFNDTQCGFKAFRMSVCRPLFEAARINRFGFDIELLYLAHEAGLRLDERAVRWNHVEGSKVSPARDGLRMMQEIAQIRRFRHQGVYDAALAEARALLAEHGATQAFTREDGRLIETDASPQLTNSAERI